MNRREFIEKNADLIQKIIDSPIDTNDMPGIQNPDALVAYSIICDICDDNYGDTAEGYGLADAADWDAVKADYDSLIAK